MHSPPPVVDVALVEVDEDAEVLLESPPPPLSAVVVPLPGMRVGVNEKETWLLLLLCVRVCSV
jgi:hypothetical protein